MKKTTLHCQYDINTSLYYCSTKTTHGHLNPNLCEFIVDFDGIRNLIIMFHDQYIFELPFMVANHFREELQCLNI